MEEVNKNTELDNTDKKLHISDVIKLLPTEEFFLKHKHKKKSLIYFEIREKLAHKELSKRELVYVLEILNNMGNVL